MKVSREADPVLKRMTAQTFYKLQESMGVQTVYNHADFRFMGRKALDGLALFEERNIYLRGLIPLIGYKSATVDDVISNREHGKSKYTLRKMLNLAFDGITSFSIRPLRLITVLGIIVALLSFIGIIYVLISVISGYYVDGWASTTCILCFVSGIQMISLGVIGEYIGRIYLETKQRPRYFVAERKNLTEE